MKKLMILSVSLLVMASCSKEKESEKESTSIGDVFNGVKTMNTLSNSMEDIQKNT